MLEGNAQIIRRSNYEKRLKTLKVLNIKSLKCSPNIFFEHGYHFLAMFSYQFKKGKFSNSNVDSNTINN